ncbi:hypothetical protein [Kitasatospora sp. NPDC092286]|uniref:hypothetical protein n=1 Tax=Kitasatospora sp. NPDC092286 TaxID=3364087 RepID=UPI00382BFC79
MKRAFGVLAALLLLGGVAYALLKPSDSDPADGAVTVTGVIGSEKRAFFQDPDVIAELAKQGLKVNTETTGSWLMGEVKLNTMDFAFPASISAAEALRNQLTIKDAPVRPFYSPLVILAHGPVAEVLAQNGLASVDPATRVWTFKMDAYLDAVKAGRKWQELKGADAHPELSGSVYLTTTDPASSSSGALYLAVLSYLQNNHQVVSDPAGVAATKDVLRTVTTMQGDQKSSSDEPFKDFVSGFGNPLVLAYESQAAELAVKETPTGDMVVLYPDTTVSSDHTIVGRTEGGRKLANLLRDNARLRELEARYGFRPQADPAAFATAVKGRTNPTFAPDLAAAKLKQAPVPSSEVLTMLTDAAKGK